MAPQQFGSPEGRAEVAQIPHQVIDPATGQVVQATPQQVGSLYEEQLADEAVERLPASEEVEQYLSQATSGSAEEAVGKYLDAAANSFKTGPDGGSLFAVNVPRQADTDGVPYETAVANDPQGYLKRNANRISQLVKGSDKLNMAVDPANPRSQVRPEVGRAAGMAILAEVLGRLNKQSAEADKPVNDRQFDGALDRVNIGKAIARRMEQYLYPCLLYTSPSPRDS